MLLLLLLLLKSVEFDDDVALLLSVAGLGLRRSSANSANQTQEKINVGGGGCVSLDPRTSLQTSEPGGMGRLQDNR